MATKPSALPVATSNVNRHLRGETNEVQVYVDGNVVINQGDLIIIEAVDGSGQQGNINYAGFPASWCKGCTHSYFGHSFVGIAMNSSPSGTTGNIAVATTGIFRFPVSAANGQTVSTGYIVSGATYGASGTSVFSQKITPQSAANTSRALPRIGMVVRGQKATTTVDFQLMGRFSGTTDYSFPL